MAEQYEIYQRGFNLFDSDDDGALQGKQLCSAISTVCCTTNRCVSEREVVDILRRLKINIGAVVYYLEYLEVLDAVLKEINYRDMFEVLDRDRDGFVSANEIRQSFLEVGEPRLTDKKLASLMHSLDVDGDGLVNYNDFAMMMRKTETLLKK
ncbi:calmodulin-beta-like [Teleopsis dalmanni]|uniref:calmodulin-beta-like n=1 Tax=Teleopsis dalmanni TaxID=139649 RepID=UPI0018CC998A|nr:calmodulin-beta-like [Teleopsis dalmanni]